VEHGDRRFQPLILEVGIELREVLRITMPLKTMVVADRLGT